MKKDLIIAKQKELIEHFKTKPIRTSLFNMNFERWHLKLDIIESELSALESEPDKADKIEILKCDVCGCHPSVIIRTNYGSFCQLHVKY